MSDGWTILGGFFIGLSLTFGLEAGFLYRQRRATAARLYTILLSVSLLLVAATFRQAQGQFAPEPTAVTNQVEAETAVIPVLPPPPLITVTQKAISVVEVSAEPRPAFPTGRLTIPKLNISAEIIPIPIHEQTWDVTQLGHNVGWLAQTGTHPGADLAMVFAGHMTFPTDTSLDQGAFAELQYATYGTEIIYQTGATEYGYTVSQISRVPPEATAELFLADGSSILLVTCTDWHPASRTYENRLIVRATRVDSEE